MVNTKHTLARSRLHCHDWQVVFLIERYNSASVGMLVVYWTLRVLYIDPIVTTNSTISCCNEIQDDDITPVVLQGYRPLKPVHVWRFWRWEG